MPVFQIKKRVARKEAVKDRPLGTAGQKSNDPDHPPLAPVQGVTPGSKEEFYFAVALTKLGLTFEYQKPFGRSGARGSQIIDFWVYTRPLPTPVYIQGVYWHVTQNAQESRIKVARVQQAYKGSIMRVVEVKDIDIPSVSAAIIAIKKELVV